LWRRNRDGQTDENGEAVARYEEADWFLFGPSEQHSQGRARGSLVKNVGAVLVMEGMKLIRIFSERDYARKGELRGRTAGSTAIREVGITSVTPDRTVEECRRIMGERRIRHLPVLEEIR